MSLEVIRIPEIIEYGTNFSTVIFSTFDIIKSSPN